MSGCGVGLTVNGGVARLKGREAAGIQTCRRIPRS